MMMVRSLFVFFLLSICFAEEIEVRLSTSSHVKPLYITKFWNDERTFDWRYLEELREVLLFDLNAGGNASLLSNQDSWEETFHWPDPRKDFNLALWKREKVSYVITGFASRGSLHFTVFNIQNGSSKRYPEIPLTSKLDTDRRLIHRFSDQCHKDLFGVEGIASLRVIYAQRFFDHESKWRSEIFLADADGANSKQLTRGCGYCITPAFFPGSAERFFFVSHKEGQSKIYQSSLSNPNPTPCIQLRGNQLLPSIHPKGHLMAFVTDVAGRPDLFIQSLEKHGKARQIFSAPRATQASPTFSPDGKKIAFVSDKEGPPRIYVLDLLSSKDTTRARPILLTQKNRENTSPAWSPDGKKLAYSAKVEGVRQIWLYDFATGEETPLTSGGQNKENPSWAPNSVHLVYNTEEGDEGQLFLIHIEKKEPIQLTKGEGQKRFPSWERL